MKNVLLTAFAACQMFVAYSQTKDTLQPPLVKISGSADVYYKYNFNGNNTDNKTSFTNSHNSFELGMISLKAEHEFKKGSIVADLGFGRRAAEFSYNESTDKTATAELAIKQLYLSYQVLDKLKISMGSFGTHVGYELLDAYLNRNYSMSYMFTNGPFFNTGVKADITISTSWTAMVGLFNPTDFKSASWSNQKYIGAQLGYSSTTAPLKLYLNYLEGRDTLGVQNHQIDFVAIYQVNTLLGLGYNGTVSTYKHTRDKEADPQSAKWWGSAVYVNLDFTPKFGLTLRGEYFDDKDALKTFAGTNGGNVLAGTLSFNYKVGNLTIVPEFRIDKASVDIFNKSNGAPVGTSPNVLLAATYHF
ncbi:Putative beta-barrel porin-2, OmpL-like. bbp2 [Chitinophaga sp. CF118]|uniref:porin n=1 Tax=Chitinophaga sp. CF118 TaxID=1884367 RepID=UPI0008DF3A20|nr:porin [Chitinophaga sp. CF118]SFD31211.1 Putative beta-barrel porin-2, OmpL-like. bbp2 [Chitinophaga sp. CF118]